MTGTIATIGIGGSINGIEGLSDKSKAAIGAIQLGAEGMLEDACRE